MPQGFDKTIRAWAYESALHCPPCAERRFGRFEDGGLYTDREGNPPHPVFVWDSVPNTGEYCDDCHDEITATHTEA